MLTKNQLTYYYEQLLIKNKDYDKNKAYYEGNNPVILADVTTDEYSRKSKHDKRIPLPMARKLINTVVGFTFSDIAYRETGNKQNAEINFANLTQYINTKIDVTEQTDYMKYIETCQDWNDYDIMTVDIATEACTQGKAYRISYFTGGMLQFAFIPSNQIFPIYSDELKATLKTAIRFYKTQEYVKVGKSMQEKDVFNAVEYNAEEINYYRGYEADAMELIKKEKNTRGIVPITEYRINRDGSNLIDPAKGMIDELDRILSKNVAEELSSFKAAILMLSSFLDNKYEDENENTALDRFRKSDIIQGFNPKNGDYAEWLTKEIQDAFVFGAYDRLKKDIFEIMDIPNFSDAESWGNTISGVSAAYRMLGFMFLCAKMFRNFSEGLYNDIQLMNHYIDTLANNATVKATVNEIQITANKVLPKNMLENSQIMSYLKDIVSTKTLYQLIPELVSDPDAEDEAINKEKEAATERMMNSMIEKAAPVNDDNSDINSGR